MLMNSPSTDTQSITPVNDNPFRSRKADLSLWKNHEDELDSKRSGDTEQLPASCGRVGDHVTGHRVEILPTHAVTRRIVAWDGMVAETVQFTSRERLEFRFRAPVHLLVVYEEGKRRGGDTEVEGLPPSTLRDMSRKLTFVPAGREYRECHEPRALARLLFLYLDPVGLQSLSDDDAPLMARLYVEDATLLDTALKLKRSLDILPLDDSTYLQALGIVLLHETIRLNRGAPRPKPRHRGGLAPWQQRAVVEYIDQHLGEPVPLATLAGLARLSPYYFCRAFKQSFGVPPHRYHTKRRIEHAKTLLATRTHSVTEIGYTVGYSETSSFTTAFRKAIGLTPSAYQRSLGRRPAGRCEEHMTPHARKPIFVSSTIGNDIQQRTSATWAALSRRRQAAA